MVKHFEDLYHYAAGPEEMLAQVLTGHLAIEFLMRQLVFMYDQRLASLADELSFARLISLLRDLELVSLQRADVLMQINKLRNRYAHEIGYAPELADLLPIFQDAKSAFTDYSGGLKDGIEEMSSSKGVHSLEYKYHLSELFLAVIYDLHQEYVARGGDEETPTSHSLS